MTGGLEGRAAERRQPAEAPWQARSGGRARKERPPERSGGAARRQPARKRCRRGLREAQPDWSRRRFGEGAAGPLCPRARMVRWCLFFPDCCRFQSEPTLSSERRKRATPLPTPEEGASALPNGLQLSGEATPTLLIIGLPACLLCGLNPGRLKKRYGEDVVGRSVQLPKPTR